MSANWLLLFTYSRLNPITIICMITVNFHLLTFSLLGGSPIWIEKWRSTTEVDFSLHSYLTVLVYLVSTIKRLSSFGILLFLTCNLLFLQTFLDALLWRVKLFINSSKQRVFSHVVFNSCLFIPRVISPLVPFNRPKVIRKGGHREQEQDTWVMSHN